MRNPDEPKLESPQPRAPHKRLTATVAKLLRVSVMNDKMVRYSALNRAIEEHFGHLAPDEIEVLADQHEDFRCTAFEVAKVGVKVCHLQEVRRLNERHRVLMPIEITTYLDQEDILHAAVGLRDGRWHLLYMGPQRVV